MPMFILRYHEIALKGRNRSFFESRLKHHLNELLKDLKGVKVSMFHDHFRVGLPEDLTEADREALRKILRERLQCVFGVVNFSYVERVEPNDEAIKRMAIPMIRNFIECRGWDDETLITFRVTVTRRDKSLDLNSMELARGIAERVLPEFSNMKVQLKAPMVELFVEWGREEALVYVSKETGAGGLPVGSAGKVVSLLSAGFDSPVASWMVMRRGATVVPVHFHSYPAVGRESIENVESIIRVLNRYHLKMKAYFIPLVEYQKEVVAKAPAPLRVLLYRRMMVRLAQRVMRREGGKALVTGESLAQVASQTLDNLHVVDVLAERPVLRPLIGTDKQEIIEMARRIGTADISAQPYEDCCALFVPRAPALAAKVAELEAAEAVLDVTGFEERLWAEQEVKWIEL